ncbi:MAG TPA: hypothetical protein VE046_10620 [Steroidobacteraceae bacterium]|nr:hypothetical protein [Steroidobacteraceae bacterium]
MADQNSRNSCRRTLALAALLCAVSLGALIDGCATLRQQMPSVKESEAKAAQLRELDLSVMRFADEYVGRVREAMMRFQATETTPEGRLAAQDWKLQQADAAYTIASGPSPVTNALDLVVLATLSRMVLEDSWIQERFGERGRKVDEMQRQLEQDTWLLVKDVLTEEQKVQLRELIVKWRAEHPDVRQVAYVHFQQFAKGMTSGDAEAKTHSGGLFSMIGLDPLANLDPAVREISQTRQLAERAIYYLQRTPGLVDMHVDRLTYSLAVMPETKTLLADLNRASLVGSAADRLAASLPQVLDEQRAALVKDLLRALDEQKAAIGQLSGDLRSTLEAGTDTANALHEALETLDRITARMAKPAAAQLQTGTGQAQGPGGQSRTAAAPFDIKEYTELVREVAATTRELDALAQRLDTALPAVRTVTQDAAGHVEGIVDHLFWMALILILITIAGVVAATLAYRTILARLAARKHRPEAS